MNPVYIIAEAGVNHNGSKDRAFQLIDAAVAAGADAVKFQTFKAENLVTKDAKKADYQTKTTDLDESQYEMLKDLELSYETHHELIAYCKDKEIQFLSTAFDFESLDFLVNDLSLNTLKMSSGDITNGPLLLAHAQKRCDLILSTGMSTLNEVEEALSVLAFGLLYGINPSIEPSRIAFWEAYHSKSGQQLLKNKVTVLHCTSEYPAPIQEINLNAMHTIQKAFGLDTGYSDHSEGIIVPIAATAMGARIIEKHFTIDKMLPGPDHQASLSPKELTEMVAAIRTVEQVLGLGAKEPMPSEIKNRPIARKSLIAKKKIHSGEAFTTENITIKRPGAGVSPMEFWDVLGSTSLRTFVEDEVIQLP